jgi:hypothetical protein
MPSALCWAKTTRPFHPHDDRTVRLALHHTVDAGFGYDVIIDAWWTRLVTHPRHLSPRMP